MPKCRECGKELLLINTSHLKLHGLTLKTYNTKYQKNSFLSSHSGSIKFVLSVLGGAFVLVFFVPLIHVVFLKLGIYTISELDYKFDQIPPRISHISPQNFEVLSETKPLISIFLSDHGGSGIDFINSKVTLYNVSNEAIELMPVPSDAALSYTPAEPLQDGRYTLTIDAMDGSMNHEISYSTFIIETRKIELQVLPDYVPEVKNNQTYAKLIIQNTGNAPLVDFFTG